MADIGNEGKGNSVKISKELIRHVAGIARVNLTDAELDRFVPELQEVLSVFDKLNELDTKDIEPSFHPVELKNALRDDDVEKSFTNEEALSNTEQKKDGYFKGPSAV